MTRTERTWVANDAVAVGRFRPEGVTGYRAKTMPDAPLRTTRWAAIADERQWQDRDTG